MPFASATPQSTPEGMRRCPNCSVSIPFAATKCPHCGKPVAPAEGSPSFTSATKTTAAPVSVMTTTEAFQSAATLKPTSRYGTRQCPWCAETIDAAEQVCPFCQNEITARIGDTASSETRRCPKCSETIKAEAIACPHCKSDLDPCGYASPFPGPLTACSDCAEGIRAAAVVCRFCHTDIDPMGAPASPEGTRPCPFCKETIKAEAVLCRYCNHGFDVVDLDAPLPTATRKCPYCAETIKAEALVCHFCRHRLTQAAPAQPKQKGPNLALAWAIVLIAAAICFTLAGPCSVQSSSDHIWPW